jgi:quercetin dioxygenase-like cupin family protein
MTIGAGSGRRAASATRLALLAIASLVVLAGCGQTASGSVATPAGSLPPVVRTVLASGIPDAAPSDRLELVRYVIQPGTTLVAHHHPGMQLALIESGTLTYTVLDGEVTVHAADGTTRSIGPGETGTIEAGEWIVEDESIHHYGKNAGSVPVVIVASSLLAADEPPAIPDASASPVASPAR